jgi:O-antigen/teichoic acid export membrane protein
MNEQTGKSHSILVRMLPLPIRQRVERRPGLDKILDNIGWLLLDNVLRMGIGLLVGVWIARYLGPEQFGQFNYAIALVGIFGSIVGLGLNGIVVRDIVRDPQSANATLCTAFVLQAVAGLFAMVLVVFTIAMLKPDDEFTRYMVIVLSVSLIFKATDAIKYWYEARVQSRHVVWVENGVFVCMAMFRVALILSECSLMTFVWLTLAEAALISIGLVLIYASSNSIHGLFQISISRAKSLMHDSWPLLLAAISVTLYMRIDMIMLEAMSSSREVGIYAAATRISEVWYFLPMIIISSVSPSIISGHVNDVDLYLKKLKRLYFALTWLALGVSIAASLLSEPIVIIFFGIEFSDAAPVLAIHLWASIAVFLGVASSQHLLIENLQKISFYRTLIGLVCNVFLNIIFIPDMGAKGAAMATVVSYYIATFSLIFFRPTRKHIFLMLTSPFKKS